MIRVVALRKAAVAGVAGAAVWEAVLRSAILLGIPTFDIVRILGTLAFRDGPAPAWWPTGMAAHALVGVCWAVFYAYFFWAELNWKPWLQGLVFSGVPAILALFVVAPQHGLPHRGAGDARERGLAQRDDADQPRSSRAAFFLAKRAAAPAASAAPPARSARFALAHSKGDRVRAFASKRPWAP